MKKRILAILMCGTMILGLTGCINNKNNFDIGEKSDIEIVENGVSLTVKEGTLTRTGVTLILKNSSNIDIQYGNPYEIEIKKENNWHKINVVLNFTLPAFELKSQETKEIELNWEHEYGTLAPGHYRIIKVVDVETIKGTYDTFYVAAEFTIK